MFSDKERIQKVIKKSNEDQLEIINNAKAMKKTNRKIIEEAAKMGYSAVLNNEYNTLHITEDTIHFANYEFLSTLYFKEIDVSQMRAEADVNNYKITGFLYVGHLFGEPVIPGGQKFRVKATGEVSSNWESIKNSTHRLWNIDLDRSFDLDQLEPVFE